MSGSTAGKSLLIFLVALMQLALIKSVKLDNVGIRVISVTSNQVQNVKVENATNSKGGRVFSAEFTLLQDLPSKNVVLVIKPYFDRKGKVVPTPIKFSQNICEALEKNLFNVRTILKSSNLTDCPVKAGTYRINKWIPNIPDSPLPVGRYQADLFFLINNAEWVTVRWNGGLVN